MALSEHSPSGAPILRHAVLAASSPAVYQESARHEALAAHLRQHVGLARRLRPADDRSACDIRLHLVPPSPRHDFVTVLTSGMSHQAMAVPDGAEDYRFAELVLALPPDWPLDEQAWEQPETAWPLRLLCHLASFPALHHTWLFSTHTVLHGEPPRPYCPHTRLSAALISTPILWGPEFRQLTAAAGEVIHLHSVIPLYPEELDFKLRFGARPLLKRLERRGVSELLDPNRANVCRRRWWQRLGRSNENTAK